MNFSDIWYCKLGAMAVMYVFELNYNYTKI